MRAQWIALLLVAATAVSAQSTSAPQVQNNPIGAQYLVELPDKKTTSVRGSVQIQSSPDGKGVDVSVAISGLPAEGGPFLYHIHEKPVPADGNCTGTGAHLDPYKRGETPPCDPSKEETCQTGDLSGKHGKITAQDFSAEYTDLYLATLTSDPSYFGNLSLVVHLANKTRISCANFTLRSAGAVSSASPVSVGTSSGYALPSGTGTFNNTVTSTTTASGSSSIHTPSSPPAQTSTPASPAGKLTVAMGAVFGAFAAVMM